MNIPGPGKYNYLKPFGNDVPKFTMRARNKEIGESKKIGLPGPGDYPSPLQINPSGKFPSSTIPNIQKIDIGADKTKRSSNIQNNNPGPQDYPQKQLIGKIFDSKHVSSQGKSMSGKAKDVDLKANYPGPGAYSVFSEFGIYGSKYAKKDGQKP